MQRGTFKNIGRVHKFGMERVPKLRDLGTFGTRNWARCSAGIGPGGAIGP